MDSNANSDIQHGHVGDHLTCCPVQRKPRRAVHCSSHASALIHFLQKRWTAVELSPARFLVCARSIRGSQQVALLEFERFSALGVYDCWVRLDMIVIG